MLEKLLTFTLLGAILVTACFAVSLTEIHGSITVNFGKQPSASDQITALAAATMQLSESALKVRP